MEKYYSEYGKFIIHFEEICYGLNHIIRRICSSKKMFDVEDKRILILLQGLTAQPILSKFKAIILTTEFATEIQLMNMIEAFAGNFQKAIEYRNFLAHGKFSYGDPHGNIEKFQVRNAKLNKKGFYDNTNIISISSLKELNEGILKLTKFTSLLSQYIMHPPKRHKDMIYKEMESIIPSLGIDLKIDTKSVQY